MNIIFRGSTPFNISPITGWFNLDIESKWTEKNNQGYNNHSVSPQYEITVSKTTSLYLYLYPHIDNQVEILLYNGSGRYYNYQKDKELIAKPKSFSFTSTLIENNLSPGKYIVELMVYKSEPNGLYTFTIQSPDRLIVKRCTELGEGLLHYHYDGKWSNEDNTAAGCSNHHHYYDNPMYIYFYY